MENILEIIANLKEPAILQLYKTAAAIEVSIVQFCGPNHISHWELSIYDSIKCGIEEAKVWI